MINVLLWISQAVLALLCVSGGAFKLFMYDELAKVPAAGALSRGAWGALGVIELVGAVLLIVPVATKRMPLLTPVAALVLALEAFGLSALYGQTSLSLTASNPLVWSLVMGALAVFIAYGRYAIVPRQA